MKDIFANYSQNVYQLHLSMLDVLIQRLQARGFTHPERTNTAELILNPLRTGFDNERINPESYKAHQLDYRVILTRYKGAPVSFNVDLRTNSITAVLTVVKGLTSAQSERAARYYPEAWRDGKITKYQDSRVTFRDSSIDSLVLKIDQRVKASNKYALLKAEEAKLGKITEIQDYYY